MTVLVTGGAGFIGSHIVDMLRESGHRVVVLDDLSTGSSENLPADVELLELDLTDAATSDVVERLAPESIVHVAAQVSVPRSVADPAADASTNVVGSIRLFEAARTAGTGRIVYITTGGALYGEPHYLPCDEDHPIEPMSPYGLSKWVAERYLAMLVPGVRRSVLRLANVYGPRQNAMGEAGVVSIFASRMLADLPVEIHGDGLQTRDFVYVGDVAGAVRQAMDLDRDVTVNIGSGTATSVAELYDAMRTAAGSGLAPLEAPSRPGDVRHSVLDVQRAARDLGWSATTPLHEGLERTVAWYREATRPGSDPSPATSPG